MTVIVGFQTDKGCYLGADSRWTSMAEGSPVGVCQHPKVERHKTADGVTILLASRGSVRGGQLLDYFLEFPAIGDMDEKKYVITRLVPQLRGIKEKQGWDSQKPWFRFVLAIRNRLFCVNEDSSVGEATEDWLCYGDGEFHAYGAIELMNLLAETEQGAFIRSMSTEEKITLIIKAVARRNWSCDDRAVVLNNIEDGCENPPPVTPRRRRRLFPLR